MNFDDFVTFFGVKELYCPECFNKTNLGYKTKTLETRHYYCDELEQPVVRRRHYCPECLTSFYTIESLES